MRTLSYPESDHDKKKAAETAKRTGGYNDFPPGWRKMTVDEFAKSIFFSQDPSFIENRQMLHKDPDGSFSRTQGPMVGAILYHFFDQTGIGIVSDYWKGTVSYFHFGCDHEFEQKSNEGENRALCPTLLHCPKCDFTQGKPDSSD